MRISDWSSDVCSSDLMIEQGRADEETAFMPLQLEPTPIDHQFGALVDALLDPGFDPCLVCGRHHRAILCLRVARNTHAQIGDRGEQLLAQAIGGLVAHRHDDGERHAALACRPESGARTIRSEEHTSEPQSLMRNSYAVFCSNKQYYATSQT